MTPLIVFVFVPLVLAAAGLIILGHTFYSRQQVENAIIASKCRMRHLTMVNNARSIVSRKR